MRWLPSSHQPSSLPFPGRGGHSCRGGRDPDPCNGRPWLQRLLCRGQPGGGGALGIIIPPSIPLILYAISANQSVGDMFLAGFCRDLSW
ncbi:TRAP transporter large permease subunit [Paracoccus marcusii]|nr:TRAP transporter large permease subunit [Paracoccus marcusii]